MAQFKSSRLKLGQLQSDIARLYVLINEVCFAPGVDDRFAADAFVCEFGSFHCILMRVLVGGMDETLNVAPHSLSAFRHRSMKGNIEWLIVGRQSCRNFDQLKMLVPTPRYSVAGI